MLTTEQILTYKSLIGIGTRSILLLNTYSCINHIQLKNTKDMLDLLHLLIGKKIIKRVSSLDYDQSLMDRSFEYAQKIIEDSCKLGIQTIGYNDEYYPLKLRSIIDENGNSAAPIVLFVKGNIEHLNDKGIAIVGTRTPSQSGIDDAHFYASKFAERGFNIISGLASGCDTAAHKGAMSVRGITTAFLAYGLDQPIFPEENAKLAEDILSNDGLLISEYPIRTPFSKQNFIERDRLQSGLADATLVVQTSLNGGTMHAVNATLHNKKPLYALMYEAEKSNENIQGNISLINRRKAFLLNKENLETTITEIISPNNKKKQEPLQLGFEF